MGDCRQLRTSDVQLLDAKQLLLLSGHWLAEALLHGSHQKHVRALACELELIAHLFFQHRRRKGAEAFAVFDLQIHHALHLLIAWITNDRAAPQRTGPELHGAVKPTDNLALIQQFSQALE